MENIEKIKPTGLFTNYIYKAIPLAFDESMSYYETLCGLLSYLKNTVIPAVNNNGDAVIELQGLYTQLESYVNNYFDNLDVQEEINNKLDDMVEEGTLQEIIATYLNTQKIYNTHEELIADSENLVDGLNIQTLGYYTINDGGEAFYYITDETNSNVYQENLGNGLYLNLVDKNEYNIEIFGAKKDDNTFDNSTIFNTVINFFGNKNNNKIKLRKGNYYFSKCIEYNYNINLEGNETILTFNDVDKNCLISSADDLNSRTAIIKNITIQTGLVYGTGLDFEQGTALRVFNAKDSLIENVSVLNNLTNNILNGIWLRENCNNVSIINCKTALNQGNLAGGSLWLWTYHAESVLQDIVVKNCEFTQNTSDEIIASWGNGTNKNIKIDDNILTDNNNSNKVMSVSCRDNTTNAQFRYNIFNINGQIRNCISLGSSNKNFDILNNTFNIDTDDTTSNYRVIYNGSNNTNINNNTFNSLNNSIRDGLVDVISGNILFNNNIVNNCCNYLLTINRDCSSGSAMISNCKLNVKKGIANIHSSSNNIVKIDNNIINLTDTTGVTSPLCFYRNAGDSVGSIAYLTNNKISGTEVALVHGVSYSRFVIKDNEVNAPTLYMVLRSDETYSISMLYSVIENNQLVGTTLNDLNNIGTSATSRIFINNTFNGTDITEVSGSPTDSVYFNIYRRLVPNYQVFNAQSTTVLGYRKTNDSTGYTTINIS